MGQTLPPLPTGLGYVRRTRETARRRGSMYPTYAASLFIHIFRQPQVFTLPALTSAGHLSPSISRADTALLAPGSPLRNILMANA